MRLAHVDAIVAEKPASAQNLEIAAKNALVAKDVAKIYSAANARQFARLNANVAQITTAVKDAIAEPVNFVNSF